MRIPLFISGLGFLLAALPQSGFAQKTYLHCGRLLDMRIDRTQTEMTVVVEKGRVVAVQPGYATGAAAD